MATLAYYFRRLVAIALGLALTGYSAWASWSHHHDLVGPLAAIAAAVLLAFCEYAWRDRSYVHFALLGFLGIAAALISASVVLERVASTSADRTHQARSANLPRVEAAKAVTEAQARLAAADAGVLAETTRKDKPGCGSACKGLKKEAEAARKELAEARARMVKLGATAAENPAAALLGPWAETFQLVTLLGLPLWLELAAPVVLAYGFAPGAPKLPVEPAKMAKAPAKRKPRKPATPAKAKAKLPTKAKGKRPPLWLVAANDR